MAMELVSLRSIEPQDEAFIYSSWLKSFRGSDYASQFPNSVYYEGHSRVIKRLLTHANVILAVSKEDPTMIYGWLCSGPDTLHYVYVKQAFRGFGIAHQLLGDIADKPVRYSHQGPFANHLPEGSIYDPWAAWGSNADL